MFSRAAAFGAATSPAGAPPPGGAGVRAESPSGSGSARRLSASMPGYGRSTVSTLAAFAAFVSRLVSPGSADTSLSDDDVPNKPLSYSTLGLFATLAASAAAL